MRQSSRSSPGTARSSISTRYRFTEIRIRRRRSPAVRPGEGGKKTAGQGASSKTVHLYGETMQRSHGGFFHILAGWGVASVACARRGSGARAISLRALFNLTPVQVAHSRSAGLPFKNSWLLQQIKKSAVWKVSQHSSKSRCRVKTCVRAKSFRPKSCVWITTS